MPSLTVPSEAMYRGRRLSADEYLLLEDDGYRYELVQGVVCMSPSPSFRHQKISTEVAGQIRNFLMANPIGEVAVEVDVRLSDDLVYRPDVVYLTNEKAARCGMAVTETPDLVVEIASPDSRSYDAQVKRADYESAGVGEYWLIDPDRGAFTFLVLRNGAYKESSATDVHYAAAVLPGFTLELKPIRDLF